MKIKKSTVARIVREELEKHLAEIVDERDRRSLGEAVRRGFWEAFHLEADDEKEEKDKPPDEKPKQPRVADGEEDNVEVDPQGEPDDNAPKIGAAVDDEPKDPEDEETPTPPEEPDDELSKDVEEPEDEEEPEGGDISDEVTGKTIAGISLNPESKRMPGAKELIIRFEEMPEHALTVFIGKSGMVKYFFKGGLHNEL